MCCKDPNFRPPSPKSKPVSNSSNRNLMNTNTKNLCPSGYSGLRPVPYDCTKFANCWKGRAIIQSCGPGNIDFTEKIKLLNFYFIFKKILFFSWNLLGTHFNARYSVCDWPGKANCQPEFPGITPRIFTANEEGEDDNVVDANDGNNDSSNIGTIHLDFSKLLKKFLKLI